MQPERAFHKENLQKQNQKKRKENSLELYSDTREQKHVNGSSELWEYIPDSSPGM